ncbi:hypothetical protein LS72_009530 [Helicobacter apodemus]|uniref:DUF1640 domain-containing protein n=1 Tax=Helicobacter apodemus TaxID=135569 RepID=A0A4U8UBW8_9HELI|nr:hypothetical protein [Helicobacter apodemus]TLE13777.1 hypothetical protein LS72_009530 [Helicobacter apodemus]
MSGYTMQRETTYHLNESFKALLASAFSNPQQSEVFIKAFEEVVNDRATTQAIRLDRLKDEAIQEIRNELLTKEVFQSEMKATKEVFEAKLEAEIANAKVQGIYWLLGVGVVTAITIISSTWVMMNFMLESLK